MLPRALQEEAPTPSPMPLGDGVSREVEVWFGYAALLFAALLLAFGVIACGIGRLRDTLAQVCSFVYAPSRLAARMGVAPHSTLAITEATHE